MKKIFILILITSTLSSCKNPTFSIETPTELDIQKAIKKNKEQEDFLDSELEIITDLDEGIKKALHENKPILLYFTGYAVANG